MEKIIVFGVGKYFSYKREALFDKYSVKIFLDNSIQVGEVKFFNNTNIRIINPKELSIMDMPALRIVLMSVEFIAMWNQLVEIGISPSRIWIPLDLRPYYRYETTVAKLGIELSVSDDKKLMLLFNNESYRIRSKEDWKDALRRCYKEKFPFISEISQMDVYPISVQCGWERGLPVDRIYIERVLDRYKHYITGDALEVAENTYTRKFGQNINESYIMHVDSKDANILRINLESGDGVRDELCDCFILTQTLMYIYNLKQAIHNCFRLLKPGGVVIITCSGISQNAPSCQNDYGCYFNFNTGGIRKLLENEELCSDIIEVGSYGNVKTAVGHIAGLCKEDLCAEDFSYNDPCYPVIIYGIAKRSDI